MSSIRLTAVQRKSLLDDFRHDPDPQVRQRAHIILLLGAGYIYLLRRGMTADAR